MAGIEGEMYTRYLQGRTITSTIYTRIYNKANIKRNILTIIQKTSGSRSG